MLDGDSRKTVRTPDAETPQRGRPEMFTEPTEAGGAAPPVHTATIIDASASARSFKTDSRDKTHGWLAHELTRPGKQHADLAAAITGPDETPMVVIAHRAPVERISMCLDAAETRWMNRQPWQTFIMRHDGSVESYNTPHSCADPNDDEVTASLDMQGVIHPDNPQILLVDIGSRLDILTVLGPGSANIMTAGDWLRIFYGTGGPENMN